MFAAKIAEAVLTGGCAGGALFSLTTRNASSRAMSAVQPTAISLSRVLNRADGVGPVVQLNTFRLRSPADDAVTEDSMTPTASTAPARSTASPTSVGRMAGNRKPFAPFQFADPSLLQYTPGTGGFNSGASVSTTPATTAASPTAAARSGGRSTSSSSNSSSTTTTSASSPKSRA